MPVSQQQPVPFSHKQHAPVADCNLCHQKASKGERAGLPAAAQCMLCHAGIKKDSPPIQTLAAFARDGKLVPWVRVYRIPDYVFFSHATHLEGKVECSACHGPVAEREILVKELPTDMKSCIDCHKARRATVTCNACHELGQ